MTSVLILVPWKSSNMRLISVEYYLIMQLPFCSFSNIFINIKIKNYERKFLLKTFHAQLISFNLLTSHMLMSEASL